MRTEASDFNSLIRRPITDADHPFLLDLYGSTREQELAQFGFPEEQKQLFIESQFTAQHYHYQTHYPEAAFDLILKQDDPIGRLYVDEWAKELRIIDISLTPNYCNKGIGSSLLKNAMRQAAELGKSVSIHVTLNNPALRLYERLGFEKINEQGIYQLMEWHQT
jgi:ribosomal protein S18 acetylase RimI-like enzyme